VCVAVFRDILTPGLQKLGVYAPADPSTYIHSALRLPFSLNPRIGRLGIAYGRYLIPPWAPEQALDDDPNIITTRRRIFFPLNAPADSVHVEYSEDVELTPEELSPERQRTGRWVYYKTWEMKPEALEGKDAGGKGVDMVMVHGACCRSQAQLET
jgi:hypothetical protein